MDGTLLDLHFDAVVWNERLPHRYAREHALAVEVARARLKPRLDAVEGTLAWYCLEHWSREFGLDVPAVEAEAAHLIRVRPGVLGFLAACRAGGLRRVLATNAHPLSLELKMQTSGLGDHLDELHSSHVYGAAKEEQAFWQALEDATGFDPERSLLIDDNLAVLRAARVFGVAHCLAIPQPDSQQPPRPTAEFAALECFERLVRETPRLAAALAGHGPVSQPTTAA
jgi:putative hydrolase of the HAD superfamily